MTMAGEGSTESPLSLPPVVASHLQSVLGDDALENSIIREAKSAQQQVFIVTLSDAIREHSPSSPCCCWKNTLQSGNNTIVVRIWRGSARWWNLHSSHAYSEFNECSTQPGVCLLARAEVSGYRLANKALQNSNVTIPNVLYFSHDSTECIEKEPWAILSYVGPTSCFFQSDGRVAATDEWIHGMITTRHEFGFEEPHPRWGRVPVDQCIDYAFRVLERFTIPMHRYFLASSNDDILRADDDSISSILKPRRYTDMIQLYRKAHEIMLQGISSKSDDETLRRIVQTLGTCIHQLQQESLDINDLPLVLCHMDCQPQNLIFYREEQSNLPLLYSVLDWEEAAMADPRFEILLLCRKVCANRTQANTVWDFYTREMQEFRPEFVVGTIDPWLQLETVHSITTLVLQSMNLLNGGRSPWETKPDLLGKIQREFRRLEIMGWTFCDAVNLSNEVI